MTKEQKTTSQVKPDVVELPVLAMQDVSDRIMSLAMAGDRTVKVNVRGEREIKVEVEKMPPGDKISQTLSLGTLVEILKIKMYHEQISDQTVYDLLFEDRLEREWARAYRASENHQSGRNLPFGGRKKK